MERDTKGGGEASRDILTKSRREASKLIAQLSHPIQIYNISPHDYIPTTTRILDICPLMNSQR